MPGLLDVISKIVEDADGDIDNVILGGLAVPAKGPPDEGARSPGVMVAVLTGMPFFVSGIPQYPVGRFDVKPGRDDHAEPAGETLGKVIHIHIHIHDSAR
jgi:hypothetical protein